MQLYNFPIFSFEIQLERGRGVGERGGGGGRKEAEEERSVIDKKPTHTRSLDGAHTHTLLDNF